MSEDGDLLPCFSCQLRGENDCFRYMFIDQNNKISYGLCKECDESPNRKVLPDFKKILKCHDQNPEFKKWMANAGTLCPDCVLITWYTDNENSDFSGMRKYHYFEGPQGQRGDAFNTWFANSGEKDKTKYKKFMIMPPKPKYCTCCK